MRLHSLNKSWKQEIESTDQWDNLMYVKVDIYGY